MWQLICMRLYLVAVVTVSVVLVVLRQLLQVFCQAIAGSAVAAMMVLAAWHCGVVSSGAIGG